MMPNDDTDEADLWFLPGPLDDEPDLLPGPRSRQDEGDVVAPWRAAQGALAGPLADLSWQLGALDGQLVNAPMGWGRRLALLEASELSWFAGERIAMDRILLWIALRLATTDSGTQGLARASWAARRLTGGPGPEEDLVGFLGRQSSRPSEEGEYLPDQAEAWGALMARADDLHPVVRAALSFHSWTLAGLDRGVGSRMEAAVTAARLGVPGKVRALAFLPLALDGAGQGLRASGEAEVRLRRWIEGSEAAARTALRHVEALRDWRGRADDAQRKISGRTPPALIDALEEWPVLSAPMAERVTGSSRASVHRALDWLVAEGLAREVTGQGRFRFWAATTARRG